MIEAAISYLSDPDVIEACKPWVQAWACVIALAVGAIVVGNAGAWMRDRRSPVDTIIRRRA